MSHGGIDILYVITDLEIGGVPLHLARLAPEMARRGHRVMVVSLAPAGPVGTRLRASGIEVCDCGGRGGWDIRVIGRLAAMLRATSPGLVHALLFHANLAARWAARRTRFPAERVLCEIQTVETNKRWHLTLDRWTQRWCRLTVGNSPSVVEHLARAGIPSERLRLVRGGIDARMIESVASARRAALPVPDECPIVFWAGRLDPVKGLDELIAAFFDVALESPAHLVLAGDGRYRAHVESLIHRRGLATRVHLLGARNDVPALLKLADVFVFPSRTEGLPNALMEAMAAGCPIVTTDVPGCRDLISHGNNGLVVRSGDVAALAAAMSRLLLDRASAVELGERARETVLRDWDIRSTHDAYAAMYHEVLQGKPSGR